MSADRALAGRGGIALLALSAGLAVASNYYIQPLVPQVAVDLGGQVDTGGFLVTVSQFGYLLGLVLFLPLGDLVDRRWLATGLMAATGIGLLAAAAAPTLAWMALCLAAFGTTSVVVQVLMTIAADVAEPARLGRTVGTVATGLLLGVLLARTAAGAVAEIAGWRGVYLSAGALVLALAAVLGVRLPNLPPAQRIGYRAQLGAVVALLAASPVLRRACWYGASTFGGFGLLWATLAPMLAGDPYHYSEGTIGLFGLAGVGGAVGALRGGRWFDRGLGRRVAPGAMVLGVIAFGLIAAGRASLAALIVGIVLLDFALQLVQVTNQGTIYGLDVPRGRLTTAYMASRFVGGAVGSALGVLLYERAGWIASSAAGAALFCASLIVFLTRDERMARAA